MGELQGSKWAAYFKKIYGGIPSNGYPICIFSWNFIYYPTASAAGAVGKPTGKCPQTNAGEYYPHQGPAHLESHWSSWIYVPSHYQALPANHWVEITHVKQGAGLEGSGSWMYYAPGSAVWFNLANTKAYTDHVPAMQDIQGTTHGCSQTSDCIGHLNDLMKAAAAKGIQSLQFYARHHYLAPNCRRQIELVDTFGTGTVMCPPAGRLKAGWEASQTCNCQKRTDGWTNCAGFGVWGNGVEEDTRSLA